MILLLVACASSLLGEWNGDCTFSDQGRDLLMSVTTQVDRDNGYLLEGSLTLETWEQDVFDGDMIGDHNGKYVMFRTDVETEHGSYQFRLQTEKVGQSLEGQCVVQAPDSVGALTGQVYLQR